MAFWTSGLSQDPKRKNRWIIYIDRLGPAQSIVWYAKKCTRPQIKVGKHEHMYLNHTFKFPGGVKWEDVTCTLVDPVSPDAAANLAAILRAGGYSPPNNENDLTTISKATAIQALGGVRIALVNAKGEHVEEWTLKNCWIKEINPDELEYNEEGELSQIEVVFAYDFGVLNTAVKSTTGLTIDGKPADGNEFWNV